MKNIFISFMLCMMAICYSVQMIGANAVGSLPGEFNVSATGAATYEIPIKVPDGPCGLKPDLKFVYNSQLEEGHLGRGWTISGLSIISRVHGRSLYDDKVSVIGNTIDDALAIDGMRLIKVSETNGEAEFRMEQDIYTRIIGYEPTQYGYKYFKAYAKDGRTLTYGSPDGDGTDVVWPLTEVTDVHGNYIKYQNITSYGGDPDVWLGRISYGKNKSGAGGNTVIEFEYMYAPASSILYLGGKAIKKISLLRKVRINGTDMKNSAEYTLTYCETSVSYHNRLESISYSQGGVKLGATKFTWTKNGYKIRCVKEPQLSSLSKWGNILCYATGDITGDGNTDYAYILKGEHFDGNTLVICNSSGTELLRKVGFYESLFIYDADNDGVDEVVITDYSQNKGSILKHFVYKYEGGRLQMSTLKYNYLSPDVSNTTTVINSNNSTFYMRRAELAGDFYGNGTIQFMPFYHQWKEAPDDSDIAAYIVGQLLGARRSNLLLGGDTDSCMIARKATGYFPNTDNIEKYKNCRFDIVNVNGNYKSDVMYVSKEGDVRFYEEQNGSFVRIMNKPLNVGGKDNIYTGDFNGDGNTDLLVIRNGKAEVLLSTGTDFVNSDMGDKLKITNNSKISIVDANGNGKSDILVIDDNVISLYVSTGSKFIEVATDSNYVINPNDDKSKQVLRYMPVVSALKNGRNAVIQYGTLLDGVIELTPDTLFDKVVKIEDGFNNVINIKYKTDKHFKSLVESVSCSYATGGGFNSHYRFSGELCDGAPRRYVGFSKVVKTDEESNTETVSSYSLKNSILQLDRTDISIGGKNVKKFEYRYIAKTLGKRLYTNVLIKQLEADNLTGTEKITLYMDYDNYGNPIMVSTTNGWSVVTKEMAYTVPTLTRPALPQSIKTTYEYPYDKTQTRLQQYEYDEQGNVTKEDNDGFQTLYSNYDVFGNCQSITRGTGANARTEKFTYDWSGRHLRSKTNCLGERTTYIWDEGQLKFEIDAYERYTIYNYDAFGNVTRMQIPGVKDVKKETCWATPGNIYGASYYTVEKNSVDGNATTWYTSDGKEVCKQTYGLGGKKVYVVKEYNKDGTLKRVSKPSFGDMPDKWAETYTYDEFGRPVCVVRADGETVIDYNGRTTTMQTPSEKIVKTFKAEGWLESITSNGKTVRYTYYPTGELKTATPDGGEPVYMEYDNQGNRTLISEADGGTVKKKYNEFGEIIESSRKQGSGAWVTTTYTYSPEGLLMQTNCGGEVTNYMYDKRNRLIQKMTGAGVSQSYEYDNIDNVIKITDRIDGREFVREIKYANYGLKSHETYPSGYSVDYIYDENNYLVAVKDMNGTEIYKPLDATASGQITSESRGGILTIYEYDNLGRLVKKEGGVRCVNQSYTYDISGNLTSLLDRKSGNSCEYTYDELGRLTDWKISSSRTQNVVYDHIKYDDANNMVRKSSLGDMILAYEDANHPHAVSSISGVPSSFPKDEQNITYTNFNKVESVSQGDKRYDITYNPDEERIKSEYTTDGGKTTRYYIGDYEEVTDPQGNVTKYHYLPYNAMMVEKGGEQKLYYNYTDRLGSVVSVVDTNGEIVEKYAYNPLGERVNPANWTEKDTRTNLICNRGFTGHEHIDGLDLINMNGRMYDPLIGSFLSVDPFIQAPDNWINYNRYMYCFGNPLKYIDPSGNIGILAIVGIGAVIGSAIGTGAGLWYGYNKGYSGWDLAKSALIGAGIGAGVGAVSGYFIGSSISSVMASKTLWNFTQAGMSIGTAVGTVGGTAYGLANNADGLALANYIGLGSLIGMAAGAAVGAGSYCLYNTFYAEKATTAANCVANTPLYIEEKMNDRQLNRSAKILLSDDSMMALQNGKCGEMAVKTFIHDVFANEAALITADAARAASVAGRWVVAGSVIWGAGCITAGTFGYHYLSNFLFDYIPSRLYGN